MNKKVGQGLSSALETGEKAADKTKGAVGAYSLLVPLSYCSPLRVLTDCVYAYGD